MAFPWAAAISAGGSILGGLLGQSSGGTTPQQKREFQFNKEMSLDAIELARQQFRSPVQTRVEDARKAGIGPLAALGLPSASVQPFGVPGTSFSRKGGVDTGDRVSRVAAGVAEAAGAAAVYKERQEGKTQREMARKVKAETDGIRLQNEMAKGRLLARQLQNAAVTSVARTEAGLEKPRRFWVPWDMTRPDLKGMGQNVVLLPHQEAAESGEGTLGAGATVYSLSDKVAKDVEAANRRMIQKNRQRMLNTPRPVIEAWGP